MSGMTGTPPVRPPGRIRHRLNHVPAGLFGCGVVGLGAVVVAALTGGTAGVLGALIGVIGVAASYVLSGLVVAWADSIGPQLTLPVALGTYVVKFGLLGVALVTFAGGSWPGLRPMAFTIIAAVVGWNVAHFWWITHAKIPYVQIEPR
ncbi:MAG: hypothetical protein QOI74_4003 [Micromonosporaceae bacterium]|jgi:hypothetical protein|nr:hypothetical protein [Micromonosporaceae bacterium]